MRYTLTNLRDETGLSAGHTQFGNQLDEGLSAVKSGQRTTC